MAAKPNPLPPTPLPKMPLADVQNATNPGHPEFGTATETTQTP